MGKMIEDGEVGGFVDGGDSWTYYPYLWDQLIEIYKPKHILDLGCGQGHASKYFMDKGIQVTGMDGSTKARDTKVIPDENFILHNLKERFAWEIESCDFIWCCELLEHVDAKYISNILDIFSRPTVRVIAMTHAFPGQGGYHHVNCQMPIYWKDKLNSIGFLYNEGLSLKSRKQAPDSHWQRSGMLFEHVNTISSVEWNKDIK